MIASGPVLKWRSASTPSYKRSTAGVAPRRRIRRHASSPSPNHVEAERGPPFGRGRGMDAQPGAGDDPECSLAADEELREIGADGRAG